jgi:hypothetical protein
VLQTAYRRSDSIESVHAGSFFAGHWTKLGLFLPAGIVLLLLSLSGLRESGLQAEAEGPGRAEVGPAERVAEVENEAFVRQVAPGERAHDLDPSGAHQADADQGVDGEGGLDSFLIDVDGVEAGTLRGV